MSEEFALIDWVRCRSAAHPLVTVGIGDDAAVLDGDPASQLVATDTLLEGVHFEFPAATPSLAGRKSLAVNLSDIAAMCGAPTAAFVSAAFPRDRGMEFAQQIMRGIGELAAEFGVAVAGGDTNIWDGPTVIGVTVVGRCLCEPPPLRSRAEVGDWIFVTGELGGSLSGKHLTFTPRLKEAAALAESINPHAMIDLSDGLSSDLCHILDESKVGAELDATAIPMSETVRQGGTQNSLEHALNDGEDFELLFTVAEAVGRQLIDAPPFETRLTYVGTIVEDGIREIVFADGNRRPLEAEGWRHRFDGGL